MVACGGFPELADCAEVLRRAHTTLVLNDADAQTLHVSRRRARDAGISVDLIAGNALASVRAFAREGPYDLIVLGGLLDYLNDRQSAFLLSNLHDRCLAPGGVLFCTNIASGNPYRLWMEVVAEWPLIERDGAFFERLLEASTSIDISSERTGLSLFMRATR